MPLMGIHIYNSRVAGCVYVCLCLILQTVCVCVCKCVCGCMCLATDFTVFHMFQYINYFFNFSARNVTISICSLHEGFCI